MSRDLDFLKYRIDSIKFSSLKEKMERYYMTGENKLKLMLANLGVIVSDDDLEIFYVVRAEDYKLAKASVNRRRKDKDMIEPDASMLFGASPAIAITKELAKRKFELMIQSHNAG